MSTALFVFAFCAVSADAEVVSYQKGDGKGSVSETDDTSLEEANPDTLYLGLNGVNGGDDTLFEIDEDSGHLHAVLKFPNVFGDGADQIPLGSLILSATLILELENSGTDCPFVYQLTEGWTEAEATWNSRRTGVSWTNAGADGTGSHKAALEGVFPCVGAQPSTQSMDVTTSVQNWSNGDLNEGWVFVNDANPNGINYKSSERATAADRPELQVTYLPSVFYSVGTNAADLKTGSPTITIASGSATLTVGQTNDIGVGDVIDYDTDNKLVYIWDVVSATEFRVQTATGTVPGDIAAKTVNTIKRAFNSISSAVTDSSNASHLNTVDLVAAGRSLTWVCYNDGPLIEASVITIDGYNVDASHSITLTVAGTSQVATGNSQRHNGTAFTGTNLTTTAGGMMSINDPYTTIEWLIFKEWGSGGTQKWAIDVDVQNGVRVRNNIFYGGSSPHDTASAIQVDRDDHLIYNNVVYNLTGTAGGRGIWNDALADNVSYINNTVYNCRVGFQFDNSGTDGLAINNISVGNTTDYTGVFHASSTNNLDSDGTAPGGSSLTATAVSLFQSLAFPENLHLRSGAAAIDAASDQSVVFSNDIDANARPQGAAWEVGADESFFPAATTHYRSVGITATNLNTSLRKVTISGWTATFDGAMPDNVGVGDVLTYVSGGNQLAFIAGRSSSTVFTVTDKDGALPTAAADVNVGTYRAYNSLAEWESGTENPNILEPTEDDVNPSKDLVTADTVMMVACYGDGEDAASVFLDTWTTGPTNYIKIYTPVGGSEVGVSQRHDGKWDTTSAYRISNTVSTDWVIRVGERYVRIDGIQIDFQKAPATAKIFGVLVRDGNTDATVEIHFSNNIVRQSYATPAADSAAGIVPLDNFAGTVPADNAKYVAKVWNNIFYGFAGVLRTALVSPDNFGTIYAFNNTTIGDNGAAGSSSYGFDGGGDNANTFFVKNNIAIDATNPYNQVVTVAGSNNNVSDIGDAPPTGARNCEPTFVNKAGDDYHLDGADACAQDFGADLSGDTDLAFAYDIDLGGRQTPWDIGADDVLATTAVELVSFEAQALDTAVELRWETGSELNNLGFHLYRAESAGGRYERITSPAIPGLGSSPAGANYSYQDSGLTNGVTYYYKLEDIETTGKTELHGPVSAMPHAGATVANDDRGTPSALITYGEPSASFLRVLKRGRSQVVLELTTGGFYAEPQEDGTVEITIPDFGALGEAGSPSMPIKRTWVEAIAGRKVKLVSVQARGLEAFTSLRPSGAALRELVATRDGTVRASRRRLRLAFKKGELYPSAAARLVSVGFQGEVKKALVELAPLRWDEATGQLLLAKRLVVRLSFRGREPTERSTDGARGRRYRKRQSHDERRLVARLATTERGLYGVRFEDVFRERRGGVRVNTLRLSRQGETVAFHVEPSSKRFKPGSMLYFVSEGASANPYGRDAVYELEVGPAGERMTMLSSAPAGSGDVTSYYWNHLEQEENRYYQAALVEAPDRWLWDLLFAPVVKRYPFELSALASTTESSRLSVWLQGVSDFPASPDHHVRVSVNGSFLEDVSWDGKHPKRIDVTLPPGVVVEGENYLALENVGDTEAAHSMVMLDRFAVSYPRRGVAESAKLEGSWSLSGVAELAGLGTGAHVLDVTDKKPRWLTGSELGPDGALRFHAESARSYLAVGPDAVLRPELRKVWASALKRTDNRADYLVIGPSMFLDAAKPLLELRQSQGLEVKAVSIEDVFANFGFGETTPEAVKDFLSYAYHYWESPPRYVVLLGDATYDYKDYMKTGVSNQVPPLMVKTSYLWTASDPAYAAVNGEDLLPDLAIGRLPAATVDEARAMVEKIVSYETGDVSLHGPAVLIADDADRAGDFQADAEELAAGVLAGRDVRKIYLSELGTAAARDAIVQSFDEGASLMSYLGHGGIHLWAGENLLNISQVGSLSSQSQQPLLLTMNCLNGYYHFPFFNSLSEELLKADGKGAIAAFSPSGLSLNTPAHLYHQALLRELSSGGHERLGDAVMAAQEAYAGTGAFPELLSIYHLLGDPALRLR